MLLIDMYTEYHNSLAVLRTRYFHILLQINNFAHKFIELLGYVASLYHTDHGTS